ncbi:MAG: hypothetical protein Q8T08_23935 [Ignavibacteria bacterium]|nr:hypothetical protein [Ignavibacteria bacterium]
MKLKLFFKLYSVYNLIGINLIVISWSNPIFIIVIILFYTLLIQEYNRVGFVNNRLKYYIIIYGICLIIFNEFDYRIIYSFVLVLIVLKLHITHRDKIKSLISRINLNESLNIYTNRFEQNNNLIEFGYEIRQSELEWLSSTILFRSKILKQTKLIYLDNEILGHSFKVNIT